MRSLTLRTLTAAVLVLVTFVSASPMAAQDNAASSPQVKPAAAPDDWSKALVESTLNRNPDATKFGGWGYARSLYLFGQYLVYKRTHDARYLDYIKQWIDVHID